MPHLKQSVARVIKLRRYRHQQRWLGLKHLRIWVPDPNRAEFAAEARRQGLSLRGRAEEAEALCFIGATFEWPDE